MLPGYGVVGGGRNTGRASSSPAPRKALEPRTPKGDAVGAWLKFSAYLCSLAACFAVCPRGEPQEAQEGHGPGDGASELQRGFVGMLPPAAFFDDDEANRVERKNATS